MTDEAEIRSFDSLQIGDQATGERVILESDVTAFAELSGDRNPLHVQEGYAKNAGFDGRVVHGMFLGSLFSWLIGMKLPGKYSLLLTESLEFKKPAMIGDSIIVRATVTSKSEATKIIELQLYIERGADTLVSGTAKVKVLT